MTRHPVWPRRLHVVAAVAGSLCAVLGATLLGGEPQRRNALTDQIVEIPIASDQISAWTKRGWRAMRRDEYESLKSATERKVKPDSAAWLERAEYAATFVEGVLREGRLVATVAQNRRSTSELLSLEPLNLGLSDVRWSDGAAAVWGVAPNGRTLIWVDRDRSEFRGRWNLKGRAFSRGFRFDIQLAPAAVSRLRLRLPDGWALSSTAGDVARAPASAEQGVADWLVELGSETSCRLNVIRLAETSTSRPLVLVNTDVSHVLRTDGLQVQSLFDVEVLESPTNRFVFVLPAEFRVFSVTFGRDEPVSWNSVVADGAQQLIVELPDALYGHGRPIRIGGDLPRPPDDRWTLPAPRLLNSTLISGKLQLRVEPPLELQSFEKIDGYEHDAALVNPSQGTSYAFTRNRDDAEMIVQTGRARLDVDARVVNHFDVTRQTWTLTSQLEWVARSGSTFSTSCSVPPQWETIEVTSQSPEDRSQISHWEIVRSADGTRTLVIEFKDALTPERLKTVRVVCQRSPVGNQQLAALPILQPRDCSTVESVLVVSHTSKTTPHLEATAAVERVDEAGIPEFAVVSTLWKEISTSNHSRLLLIVNAPVTGQSALTLENSEPDFDAEAQTTLELQSSEFRESFVAKIVPKAESVKNVFVYLSQSGVQPAWQVFAEPESQVTASRVPLASHSEWNLPTTGELWELRLARSQDRPFRIVGSRKSLVATSPNVALMFLPAAEAFRGRVEMQVPNDLNLDVEASSLRSVADSNSLTNENPGRDAIAGWVARSWLYESLTASLEIRIASAGTIIDPNLWALLEVNTVLATGSQDGDRHRAVFRIMTDSAPAPIRIRVPEPALLLSLRLNGKVVAPSRQDSDLAVLTLTRDDQNVVEIQYETPKTPGLFFDRHTIPVPQCSVKVLSCDWEVSMPSDTFLAGTSKPILADRKIDNVSWSQRLFGPLGRSSMDEIFNPLSGESWQRLISSIVAEEDQRQTTPYPGSRSGSAVVRGRGPGSMDDMSLTTWSGFRASCLGWMVLVLCAATGLALRMRRADRGVRVSLVWLSIMALAAAAAPAPFTSLSGGALAGTLIAVLLPRLSFVRRTTVVPQKNAISLGSTATFGHGSLPVQMLVFIACLGTVGMTAGYRAVADGPVRGEWADDDLKVLVPNNAESTSTPEASLVYLSARLYEALQAATLHVSDDPPYLISTAEYRGRVDEQSFVTIEAKFRVLVLSSDTSTRVRLPISNANLGGDEACLVNGKPHPIFLAAGGAGYELDLFRHGNTPVVARKPRRDAAGQEGKRVDSTIPPTVAREPESFEVFLRLRPTTTPIAGGAQLTSRVPAAADASVFFEFDKLYASVVVAGDAGEVVTDHQDVTVQSQLGKTTHLDVAWSASARRTISSASMEASVSCLVETHPAWLGYRYHVDYRVLSGQVDFIHWQVPTRAIVRSVESNSLGLNFSHERASGESKLFIDLSEPQSAQFSINAYLIVPIDSTGNEFQVPAPDLIGKPDTVKVLLNQIGVTAPPEFLLSAKTVESNDIARISGESFTSAARLDALNTRTPLFAYRLQAASVLTFELSPEPTVRKVRQSQTGRVGARDLEWEFSAEVEVGGRPAFEHTLIVDPGLRIESITVQEDKAERLVRWSSVGEKIHLFLSDETTGTQQIQLRGRAPLQLPATVSLPLIRVEGAELSDSTLTLFRQPDVSVEVASPAALEASTVAEVNRSMPAGEVLIGRFRCKPDGPRPQVRVIRQSDHVRVDTATVITRHPGGGAELSIALLAHGTTPGMPNFRLLIPPELASTNRIRLINAQSKSEKRDDGSVELVLTHGTDPAGPVIAVVTADVTPPTGEWKVPRVGAIDADTGANYLLISPADGFVPEVNSTTSLVPATLPSWIHDAASFDSKSMKWSAYTGDVTQWVLTRGTGTPVGSGIRVPLVSTHCWWERSGEVSGFTEIFAITSGPHELVLNCPLDTHLSTLCVDGQLSRTDLSESNELTLRLDGVPKAHIVVMAWSRPHKGKLPEFGVANAFVPRLVNVEAERSLCTIVPPADRTLLTKAGSVHLDALSASLSRLEGLVAIMWESADGDRLQSSVWELVIDTRNICVEQFKSLGGPFDRGSESGELHDRFQRVQEEIKRLQGSFGSTTRQRPQDATSDLEERFGILRPMLPGNPNLMQSDITDSKSGSMSYLVVNSQWIVFALCLAGLLLVPTFLFKFVPEAFGTWFSRWPSVRWAAGGLLWWSCLALSAGGLILMGIAVFVWLTGRRRLASTSN